MNINTENLDKTLEHWASIDGYLNYQVSWFGRVLNTKTGRILKPQKTHGYNHVNLSRNGKAKLHRIHVLVAREWVPNPEGKRCVDHIDGNRANNNWENLRYATHSENSMNQKIRTDGSSVYKGVSYQAKTNKWKGTIVLERKFIHLGLFECEREAAEAYNAAAVKFHKEFARLNDLD
ncbi:MAG: HNH endonuclease [Bacteroidia bacterium]|nr:HNH endonuclease [Bacteroidia bacterium]